MTLTLGDALTILGIIGSFLAAVVVGAVRAGGDAKRIDRIEKDVEGLSTTKNDVIELKRDLHAVRGTMQQSEVRAETSRAELRAAMEKLSDRLDVISEGVVEIRAALKTKE